MDDLPAVPALRNVVLDCPVPRVLAEFYRVLFGWTYHPGHEDTDPAGDEWLVLRTPDGMSVAFQQVPNHVEPTWPDGPRPQMLHLDFTVSSIEQLRVQHRRALDLGAQQLRDRSTDPAEPLYVLADPAGHPFCLFVG